MYFPKKIDLWLIAGKLGLIVVGVLVLMVSIAQTTLRIMAVDEVRNNPIQLTIKYTDGTTEQTAYKFPQVNILPDNPFYGIKRIRDWMWLMLVDKEDKPRVALLLADKKMTEMDELSENERGVLAIEAGKEALNKLEYAHSLETDVSKDAEEIQKFRKQLFLAGNAYIQIIGKNNKVFETNQADFDDLQKKINDWSKKQEEESWQWRK